MRLRWRGMGLPGRVISAAWRQTSLRRGFEALGYFVHDPCQRPPVIGANLPAPGYNERVERQVKMPVPFCVILSTAGSQAEADRLAELLVSRRLAACVQIMPVSSCYVWKGELTRDAEFLLLIKTASHLYPQVQEAIVQNHSYEVPEVIRLPVEQGLGSYLGWIAENTR